ncbi:hypothetical protein HID58_033245 [Brassica napus]|uniref:Synergin gamma C-terminal domain-containing protein n=1 Tax=Brassica napus TaxID=3708 RepID=A0ABQ8BYP2_BRANA|nr:uncharacterized protein LOC106433770 isoform X1 [Brassica napus]KAH0909924.1 hypothetical protein HID58_033245 [Brassica napus]
MLASNPPNRMNGLDFFFSPSPPVAGEDDDWGEFVDSSPNPNGFSADRTPTRIESEKNSQTQWVTPRGPVPLSVFGEAEEEEEEEDESGAPLPPFKFSFDSFSPKHNGSANTNPRVEISGLIANLYRESEHSNEINGNEKEPGVSLESFSWNPLNLASERSEKTSDVDPTSSDLSFVNRNDDDDDFDEGWEFKAAESVLDPTSKEEQEKAGNGSVVVKSATDFDSSMWSSPTTGKRENGDDGDPWGNGGWEFNVAETKKDLTNKESNGWGFGFGFEHGSEMETTTSYHSNNGKDLHKEANGSISSPSNANVNPEGSSWAFNQASLDTGNEKEENEVLPDKPKGVLPLSFFEDEALETSDNSVHEDNLVSTFDFPVKEKTKAPSQTVSISDLISSLYSQVEEKNAANLSEKSATVNGEDESWEFQGPTKTITDSSLAEGGDDDFDSTWEFQGPSLPLKNSDAADEVDDDSWEFQGPAQPVKDNTLREGDNGLWESKQSSVENEVGNRFSVPNGFGKSQEETVITIDLNDYRDVFHKLKTELYYLALSHLETLKEARDLAANSDEVAEAQKYDDEIQDLQNMLKNDVLIGEVNVESLQVRSSGTTELYKVLQEPKFRTVDSDDLLSERLLLAEKDWKSTIELLKHATLTLKVLNLGSHEQQSKYASTWLVIARTCAQELRHAACIWKQVIQNDVQEEILSKPQGKRYLLSVGEIYRVVKILRASTRLYKPWIVLFPTSSTVLAVLDECVELWLSSGLEEALRNNIIRLQGVESNYSADQLLESIRCIDEVDAFTLHACITSDTSPTCCISALNTEIVPGIKMVEWNGEHYLVSLANLWANLISRDSPDLAGHGLFTGS